MMVETKDGIIWVHWGKKTINTIVCLTRLMISSCLISANSSNQKNTLSAVRKKGMLLNLKIQVILVSHLPQKVLVWNTKNCLVRHPENLKEFSLATLNPKQEEESVSKYCVINLWLSMHLRMRSTRFSLLMVSMRFQWNPGQDVQLSILTNYLYN